MDPKFTEEITADDGTVVYRLADTTHYRTDPEVTSLVIREGDMPFVGTRVCPRAPVNMFTFAYHKFGSEHQELFDTHRGPGQRVKVADITRSREVSELEHHALAVPFDRVYDGHAWGEVPVDWKVEKANVVRIIQERMLEHAISTVLRTQASYTNKATPSTKWGAGSETPVTDIDTAINTVEDAVGIRPQVMLIGDTAWRKLKRISDITDRIKYANPEYARKASVTAAMVADIFDLEEVIVASSSYKNAAGVMTKFWGDDVIICVRPPAPGVGVPSFAYTFTLRGYPVAIAFSDEAAMSDYIGWADGRKPKIVGDTFGYLLYGTTA